MAWRFRPCGIIIRIDRVTALRRWPRQIGMPKVELVVRVRPRVCLGALSAWHGREWQQEAHRLVRRAVPAPMFPLSADADVSSPVADVGSRGDCFEGRLTRPLGGSVPLSWRHSSNVWALLRIDGWHGFFQRQPRIARVSGVSCRMGETGFAVRACASASGRMVIYRNWCSPKPLRSDGGLLKT